MIKLNLQIAAGGDLPESPVGEVFPSCIRPFFNGNAKIIAVVNTLQLKEPSTINITHTKKTVILPQNSPLASCWSMTAPN